jgi:tetratricopeptide (TPR) repeat protein
LEMKADSHRQWGDDLRRANVNGGEEIKVKAREQFREAGKTFSEVAKMRFEDPEYVELLWKAIDAYQAGRSFEESLVLLDEYLQYEDRTKHPRGLIAKGKALTAVGRPEQSLVPLTDCIAEFPRDSLSYEARLLSAVGLAELGRTNEARLLLEENVQDQWLSPESPVYRDSLYVLGDLLHRQAFGEYLRLTSPTLVAPRLSPGDQTKPELAEAFHANQRIIEAAIVTLEDAEQRDQKYGNLERSRRAAYLAAEAHRLAAYWPGIQAADPDTLQSARNQLNQLRAAELARANAGYNRLRNLLGNEMSSRDELLPWEQAMLRNCFMGVADTLFEMNDIAAAATAYQKASQEFMNEPLALEALMQQSRCYEKLGKLEEAKKIYKQAAVILDRIPTEEDHRFAQTTRYDRKDWIELLNWLQGT